MISIPPSILLHSKIIASRIHPHTQHNIRVMLLNKLRNEVDNRVVRDRDILRVDYQFDVVRKRSRKPRRDAPGRIILDAAERLQIINLAHVGIIVVYKLQLTPNPVTSTLVIAEATGAMFLISRETVRHCTDGLNSFLGPFI